MKGYHRRLATTLEAQRRLANAETIAGITDHLAETLPFAGGKTRAAQPDEDRVTAERPELSAMDLPAKIKLDARGSRMFGHLARGALDCALHLGRPVYPMDLKTLLAIVASGAELLLPDPVYWAEGFHQTREAARRWRKGRHLDALAAPCRYRIYDRRRETTRHR